MVISEQLPILAIVVPLVCAPFTVLMPSKGFGGRLPWAWATLVSWLAFAICVSLLHQVMVSGPISYHLGDWAPPVGIEYRVDLANALVLTIVSGIAAAVFPFAYESVRSEIDERQTAPFYTALLICLTGMLGVTITGDAFNVFVFLEISSLSGYALIAMGAKRDRRALTASFNYLVMGTIGATFFVIGLGLLYMATGTLNMADLHDVLMGSRTGGELIDNRVVQAGFAFIVVGVGLKAAMFPLHLWLPGAYTYAPSAVTAFIASTATKVSVYVLIRFVFTVFGTDFNFVLFVLHWVLFPIAIAGMFVASLVAIFQADVKRMLAYSSVAQIGYMLLGIAIGTQDGVAAALIHVANHAMMKGALFMAVACVVFRLGDASFSAFNGLGRRMPVTAWAFIISGLSLIGVPPTVGFISKWYLLQASLALHSVIGVLGAFLIVASSLLAVVYIGRVAEAMLMKPAATDGPYAKPVREAPLSMLIPMWVLVVANVYFGLRTHLTVDVAMSAARALLNLGGVQ